MSSLFTQFLTPKPDRYKKRDYDISTAESSNGSAVYSPKIDNSANDSLIFSIGNSSLKFNQRSISIRMKRQERMRKKRIIKQVIGKIVLNQYHNIKYAFIKIGQIPKQKRIHSQQQQNLHQNITQKLIFNTSLTIETAILRSIINAKNKKQKQNKNNNFSLNLQNNQKKISLHILNHSVTVYPHQQFSLKIQHKFLIMILNNFLNQKIKKVIHCFKNKYKQTLIAKRYLTKVLNNTLQNQRVFINKLKKIVQQFRQNVKNTKKKRLQCLLTKCVERRHKILIVNIIEKGNYEKGKIYQKFDFLGKRIQNKKIQAFQRIKQYCQQKMKNDLNISWLIQSSQIRLFEEHSRYDIARQLLLRIIARQHLLQWKANSKQK